MTAEDPIAAARRQWEHTKPTVNETLHAASIEAQHEMRPAEPLHIALPDGTASTDKWMANAAHVVMVMADNADYPSRVFESLIEAKAFAMAKQERAGGRVYVVSVALVRAKP